jgi:hypothetical protein
MIRSMALTQKNVTALMSFTTGFSPVTEGRE